MTAPAKAAPMREDVTQEMALFESAYPLTDHAKYKNGNVIAGRIRYAEPYVDQMFSAWLASARHRLAHPAAPQGEEGASLYQLRPNLGAETDEPSLGEMVLNYYRQHYPIGEAFNLRDQYFAALAPAAIASGREGAE